MEGSRSLLTERRLRRFAKARNQFYHRVKNGVHDPLTFFHLVEELANIRSGHPFTAAELAAHLNDHKHMIFWDSVVVGRILNDLAENWAEANPGARFQPLVAIRRWSGREYMTNDFPEARAVLLNLLDDLAMLGEQTKDAQAAGKNPARLASPLNDCPSISLPLGATA